MNIALWIGASLAGLGLLTAGWRAMRTVSRLMRSCVHFFDDWFGVNGRPGVESRPGVMARLHNYDVRLETLESEFRANGGRSTYDQLNRIERAVRKAD